MGCNIWGTLWFLSYVLSSMGSISQIKHNSLRRSVLGLSFFDAEIRLYGKLPWILFACGVGAPDFWILAANCLGIALAVVLLVQFLLYSDNKQYLRVSLGIVVMCASFYSSIFFESGSFQEIAKSLPVIFSIVLIPIATYSQFSLNTKTECSAVCTRRYFLYLLSNIASFAYGLAKIETVGFYSSWPIISAATIGICANVIILRQVLHRNEFQLPVNYIEKGLSNGIYNANI